MNENNFKHLFNTFFRTIVFYSLFLAQSILCVWHAWRTRYGVRSRKQDARARREHEIDRFLYTRRRRVSRTPFLIDDGRVSLARVNIRVRVREVFGPRGEAIADRFHLSVLLITN